MTLVSLEGDEEMLRKKKLCPKCKTGMDSYEEDRHSEVCPYINCLKNGKCSFYVPLEKPSILGIFKKNKDKQLIKLNVKK